MTEQENAIGTATSAFFLTLGILQTGGMRDAERGVNEDVADWHGGQVGFATDLARIALKVHSAIDFHWRASNESFPGIPDYEVTEPLGKWIGEFIVANNHLPHDELVDQTIKEYFDEFLKEST